MTTQETIKILAILKTTYPRFFISADSAELQLQINTWSELLVDDPYNLVAEAVKALTCTLKFPPTIADIKEKLYSITHPAQMSEMEAWQVVRRAVDAYERYDVYSTGQCARAWDINNRIMQGLPPVIKRIVGDSSQLREWQDMDTETFNSVVQSNFLRSYRALAAKEAEVEMLPQSTRQMMQRLGEALRLPGKNC
jgi:hypothetical protein